VKKPIGTSAHWHDTWNTYVLAATTVMALNSPAVAPHRYAADTPTVATEDPKKSNATNCGTAVVSLPAYDHNRATVSGSSSG